MRWRVTIAGICLIAVIGSVALGQRVSLAVARGDATHDLQPNATGFTASFVFPVHARIGAALTLDRLRGDAAGVGIVCVGLIDPDDCPSEPYTQNGPPITVGVGPEFSVYQATHVGISLRPQLLVGSIRSETLGYETGKTLSAIKTEVGVSLSAEVRVTPLSRIPIDVAVGAALGNFGSAKQEQVVDGYTPFEGSFTRRMVYAGVAFTRRGER